MGGSYCHETRMTTRSNDYTALEPWPGTGYIRIQVTCPAACLASAVVTRRPQALVAGHKLFPDLEPPSGGSFV